MKDFYCEKILSGLIPVKKVLESEHILAFHHTQPQWDPHIVVIPKIHIESFTHLMDENPQILVEMMNVIKTVVSVITEKNTGCRLTTNFGSLQKTKHLHWHIYCSKSMV